MLVDVVMCTWNSDKPYFKRVLESIKREIPVHCFILVDKFSSDNTVQRVRTYFPYAKIILSNCKLAKARQIGIKRVDTEFFVFIDDDIVLPKGWYQKLWENMDPLTGAISGIAIPASEIQLPYEEKWRKWNEQKESPKDVIEVTEKKMYEVWGYTNNTIIKSELCKDWNPSADLPVFEDQVLLWHIVKKGYKWKILPKVSVQHYCYSKLSELLKKVRWRTAGGRLIGVLNYSLTTIIKQFVMGFLLALKASKSYKEPRIIPYVILLTFAGIDGYLHWTRHVYLHR